MPVYKDKERGTYYYSFSHKGKRIRSKRYENKKDCEKALAKAVLEADKIATDTYTFNQVATIFLQEKKSRLKRQSYDRLGTMLGHFLVTLGEVRVDRLSVAKYQQALNYLDNYQFHGKRLKNAYKNKVVRTFKQLCTFANKRYDLFTNVPEKFEPYRNEDKEEMHIITLAQFRQLLEVVNDPMYTALFTTLFYMGFRIGEALALKWSAVDFEANTISVKATVTTKVQDEGTPYLLTSPKTKASIRTLPMPQSVSTALLGYRDKLPTLEQKSAEAFVFGATRPIAESTIQNKKNRYFKQANLEPIRLHDFRHSCASFLINKGATPLLVSKWLGHANVSMTLNTYSHLWSSELEHIVQVIDANN